MTAGHYSLRDPTSLGDFGGVQISDALAASVSHGLVRGQPILHHTPRIIPETVIDSRRGPTTDSAVLTRNREVSSTSAKPSGETMAAPSRAASAAATHTSRGCGAGKEWFIGGSPVSYTHLTLPTNR